MSEPLLDRIIRGDELDAKTFPALAWTVPGVIPEGFGLMVGAPKLGKSWLALGVGLALTSGGVALGAVDVGAARPVLYLALEDGERRLQGRCRTLLGEGVGIPSLLHLVITATPAEVPELIREWLERYSDRNPLVLLDTLGKVMPPALPGESAYARDYRVGSTLKGLSDAHPGSTLLVVHHTRKGAGEDWMDSTSGTQGLNGSADFTVALTRARNTTDAVLKVTGRDVPEAEYAMTASDGQWTLQGASLEEAAQAARAMTASDGLGDKASRIVAWVSSQRAPVTPAMVAKALGADLGMTNDSVGQYLRRAAEGGRIRQVARGFYGPVSEASEVSEREGDARPGSDDSDTTDTSDTPLGEGW